MTHSKTLQETRYNWGWRLKKIGITKRLFCIEAGVCYDAMWRSKNPTLSTLEKTEAKLKEMENEKQV